MTPWIWLILCVVLVMIEAGTAGLTTIWFAGGSLVGLILSLFKVPVPVQIFAAIIVSVLLLVFTRPAVKRLMDHKVIRTNAESLIGTKVLVTEEIDNGHEKGAALANGQTWTARAAQEGRIIPAGEHVTVREIRGVKLIVE
ncbi:MAG: NfeD family protein [Lachnospiraceae bacterium]|nr:NfeD family protein [Lachnospiraceae bacterium]